MSIRKTDSVLPLRPSLEAELEKLSQDSAQGRHRTLGLAEDALDAAAGLALKAQSLVSTSSLPNQEMVGALAPTARKTAMTARPSSLTDAFAALDAPGGPGQVRLLEDNTEAWASRWAMLESAEHKIDSGYFILEKDIFGFSYLGALLKAAREGKEVRLMLDAMADTFGERGFKATFRGQDYLQELAEYGVGVKVYHPVSWRPFELFSRDFLACNHDKILVVDGKVSATGGRNIAWDYFVDPKDNPIAWRDTDVQIFGEGPAKGLTDAFTVEFDNKDVTYNIGKDLFGNWRKRDIELLGAYRLMDIWMKAVPLTSEEKELLRNDPAARKQIAEQMVKDAVSGLLTLGIERPPDERELKMLAGLSEELVRYTETRGASQKYAMRDENREAQVKILDKTSTAGTPVDAINKSLIALAAKAQKRIVIENPYVVLTEEMVKSLEAAGKRGVEIVVITNSPLSTDSTLTQAFFLEDWPYMLARIPNLRVFVLTGERKLHAKAAYMDDDVAIVSTYNMDFLSAYVNSEVAAAMLSPGMVADVMKSFVDDENEPKNGVLEYKIMRDADGQPVIVDDQPVVAFGPENHLPAKMVEDYKKRRKNANFIRTLPWFGPLRHPPLDDGQGGSSKP